ncbi:uncharacterized protein LOC129754614 [Uranotaenia lowii]|uniref:uncharacterized protein LOC129754614 n=1 Tax=Uranotaenia lowii TaxID=190385 RepID=UPI0024793D17|nr:uncharacterized protein LOC129754614 [Uranotaenia lowii]
MDNLEKTKENIQPLRGGRNMERLETALSSESQILKERSSYEERIEKYEGEDPLQPWYDYICWIEQTNLSCGGKHTSNNAILLECIRKFENDTRYQQDHRFIKLCIKHIDTQSAPQELYQELYERGIGTLCAEMYIGWAYYYDAEDNFSQTEAIYQRGFDAGAKPREELEQAHQQFGFSMSQRMLHKDESSKMKFKSTLEERRNALTSLRTHNKKHVSSTRTGLAVRSTGPGIVEQRNPVHSQNNAQIAIHTEGNNEKDASSKNHSIVHSLVNMNRDRENVREPGPWTNAKCNKKRGPLFATSHGPSFAIPEDSIELEPVPLTVNNYDSPIKLPSNHKPTNYPQKPFIVKACDDDKPGGFPMYDKLALYCCGDKEDFSLEELHAYHYFKRKGINNALVRQYEPIWGNGAQAGIRLHPYHVSEYKFKNDMKTEIPDIHQCVGIQTKIKEIYASLPNEELSIEELRFQKLKDGTLKRHINKKHDDDMLIVDMDETIIETKRISIAPPRGPIQKIATTKSVFHIKPTSLEKISEDPPLVPSSTNSSPEKVEEQSVKYTGAIKKDINKRRSEESPGLNSGRRKKPSFEGKAASDEETKFVAPTDVKPKIKITIPIFVDEDEPTETKDTNNYYPNETCSTQMFNMFVKSQSTPVDVKSIRSAETNLTRQKLSFDAGKDMNQIQQQDENIAQSEQQKMRVREDSSDPESAASASSNVTQAPKQLSTIMERTETSTISGGCSTKSSVPSPPFDEFISPSTAFEQERSINHSNVNMKQAVKNLTSSDAAFKVPETAQDVLPTIKPVAVSPFIIHIDSTETMAKIPLISQNAIPLKNMPDDKENKEGCTTPITENVFQIHEDGTATTTNVLRKNISELPQREVGMSSLMSFKMTTERTNTVPLPLVKHVPGPSTRLATNSEKPPNAEDSLFELLLKTPSPKKVIVPKGIPVGTKVNKITDIHNHSSFDLADFSKTPKKKNVAIIKQEKSLDIESVLSPPKTVVNADQKPLIIQSVMGAINLDDFPSPQNIRSSEDLNTEIFSLNMANMKNSTLLPGRFTQFDIPDQQRTEISPDVKKNLGGDLDHDISMNEVEMCKLSLEGKKETNEFKIPAPLFKSPPIIDLIDECDSDELGKSIYIQKQINLEENTQKWEEIDENFNPANNHYHRKEIDLNSTTNFIQYHTNFREIDPFDPKLQEAFLEKLDFMGYIEDLTTCTLVNKVQPLSKGMVLEIRDEKFAIVKKIGEGTFGTIFCGKKLKNGETIALKQERPANLWEYYICLELRSRINYDDILPGFMEIEYALVGNNASILVSQFSKYGNILDVCNLIKRTTNKNVDEFIAMIITTQILSIIDHLHSCMIIHADIKPDNFLLMTPINMDSSIPCVQLIDFGVSIDLKLFRPNTTFTKVVTTECFTCIEMIEKRPWTFQPDLYGVAGTTHVMLFGKYMEVEKDIINWHIKTRMPRYFRKHVWDHYFGALLNIRDCNEMPNLQKLRSILLAQIEENEKYIRDKISEFNQALLSA